ncbi:restriction endonuclease subunit S [Prolixibacter denitrificans]|uniref:Type I restriction enzyme S subunit n=1 Tax=Prolixibacter denitrificans TaxID=1541063 RepID=A0A2P8C6D1_9BACT|nr:restriction endonuclease subunit S [Prolixibacter denitrificans]PSK80514.1 type I restriction enzyme S subunit [Prolixibacter denitrificans]GET22711.1 hypothetical protein JCM18694_29570 [Prolixibacter denitrificans]
MSEWKKYKIHEIALNMADAPFGSNLKTKDYVDNGVLVIQGKNIQGRKCIWNDRRYVTIEKYNSLSRHQAKIGSLVFPKVGTIGKVGILTSFNNIDKFVLSTNTMMLEPDPEIAHQDFVYYFFSSFDVSNHIQTISSNSVQPVFNFTALKNYPITLPPLPEQKAIAEVLSSLDDKIDLLHRQNQTLEAMAETLFRQWFVEEAEENWREGSLGDLTDNIKANIKKEEMPSSLRYVALEHIDKKSIALNKYASSASVQSNKFQFIENDILFGKLRPYFHKVCFAPFPGVCSTDILVIRAKSNAWFAFSLFAFFQTKVVDFANSASGGTRMPRTNWNTLAKFPIAIPPIDVVTKFNDVVNPSIEKIKYNQKQIRVLEKMRDTLLPKLMSGEVRVNL